MENNDDNFQSSIITNEDSKRPSFLKMLAWGLGGAAGFIILDFFSVHHHYDYPEIFIGLTLEQWGFGFAGFIVGVFYAFHPNELNKRASGTDLSRYEEQEKILRRKIQALKAVPDEEQKKILAKAALEEFKAATADSEIAKKVEQQFQELQNKKNK